MKGKIMNTFKIIPAIDLLDGKVVRLYKGDYAQATVYREDAAAQALEFVDAGADLIHIVDLNGARNGDRTANRKPIETILETIRGKAELEIGGGIRDFEALDGYLQNGVQRGILGTSAVKDPEFLKAAIEKYGPERIIVGVDARDGRVKVSGWEEDGGITTIDFVKLLEQMGVIEIIFTDIRTDGALSGPALDSIGDVLNASSMNVIASGGISALKDVQDLLEMGNPRLVGAITGRAVYEKRLHVHEAVQLALKLSK